MDGQSLLDQYPFPGQLSDPAELEKAKYLALMRMGMGLMGKEPIGTATGHGLATYATMEENARRNADQKMQEMAGRMKYAIEMNKEALAAKKQKQLEDYGKNFDVSQYYAAGGSPQELEYARKNPEYWPKIFEKLKPETMSPGQMRYVPGIGFTVGLPDKDGMTNVVDPSTFRIIGRAKLPGQIEAVTAETLSTERVKNQAAAEADVMQVPTGIPGQTKPKLRSQMIGELTGKQGATDTALRQFKDAWAEESVRTPVDAADAKRQQLALATLKSNIEKLGGSTQGTTNAGINVTDPVAATLRQEEAKASLTAIAANHPIARSAVEAIDLQHKALAMLDSGEIKSGKLGNISTGFGAWLQSIGYNEGDTEVANTQAFMIMQAKETLAILKTGALGSGQSITKNDKEFAERIAGGDITVTEETLRKIIKMNEKAHRDYATNFNKDLQSHAKAYQSPTIVDRYGLEIPGPYTPPPKKGAVVENKAPIIQGRAFKSGATGATATQLERDLKRKAELEAILQSQQR